MLTDRVRDVAGREMGIVTGANSFSVAQCSRDHGHWNTLHQQAAGKCVAQAMEADGGRDARRDAGLRHRS